MKMHLFCSLLGMVFTLSGADLNDLTYEINEGQVTITDCLETAAGELVVPATVEGLPVVAVGAGAFASCGDLTGISLPSSLTSIGVSAFFQCSSLQAFQVPEGVTVLAANTFRECTSLAAVTLPEGLHQIGASAFYQCSALSTVTLPSTITILESSAFAWCGGLTAIHLPEGLLELGDSCFYNCGALAALELPASLSTVGSQFLYGCRSLPGLTLAEGSSHFSVLEGVLYNASQSLLVQYPAGKEESSLVLPESVTAIGDWAVANAWDLQEVVLPTSLRTIGARAFYGSLGIVDLDFPQGLLSLGDAAFFRCAGLQSVTLPASLRILGSSVFVQCSNLSEIYFEGNRPGDAEAGEAGSESAIIYVFAGTSGWGETFRGRPVEVLGSPVSLSLSIISGVPTLAIDSAAGESFEIFRSQEGVFSGEPLVPNLPATGALTLWEDPSALSTQGAILYRVRRHVEIR
ncbi:leucine-rich repeat domain-containing protein [Roseibacillus ishigakijimensis]|uniref:Leucine-rich repeat domain-containing protein n=1 Tax=Roseibacillus ishigakijimensis TaxID=454146 RepID=A0A934RK85_9BACT|nr:leucine-rich repeat domain-containing protein [Roseibacillus ishigakijimensis]MBK1833242.1 leucine-rich repeat domain-containing protein [Roseibacillus ishigakijimensis]